MSKILDLKNLESILKKEKKEDHSLPWCFRSSPCRPYLLL